MNEIRQIVWDWMIEYSENKIHLNGHNLNRQLKYKYLPEVIDLLYTVVLDVQSNVLVEDGSLFRVEFIKDPSQSPIAGFDAYPQLWNLYRLLKLLDVLDTQDKIYNEE